MTNTVVDVEQAVGAYLAVRDARQQLLADYESKDTELKSDLEQIEAILLSVCNEINADSIRTSHGTAMRKLSERFYTQDWDGFYKFVLENESPQLLEKRIHQSNMREFLEQKPKDFGLPPGVNVMREYTISVRKSS